MHNFYFHRSSDKWYFLVEELVVSNGRRKLCIVWGAGGRNKLSVVYTSSRYLIGLCSIFDCSSFQFWATTSVSWHEGILDDGLCHFGAVGAHRLGSDFAAGLIYVLFFSWITLSLADYCLGFPEGRKKLTFNTFYVWCGDSQIVWNTCKLLQSAVCKDVGMWHHFYWLKKKINQQPVLARDCSRVWRDGKGLVWVRQWSGGIAHLMRPGALHVEQHSLFVVVAKHVFEIA